MEHFLEAEEKIFFLPDISGFRVISDGPVSAIQALVGGDWQHVTSFGQRGNDFQGEVEADEKAVSEEYERVVWLWMQVRRRD